MNLEFVLNNGNKIPAVGYGTWQATDEELEKALEKALEVGYRHIDTAAVYFNEHVIGKVINRWISSGKIKREELFIVTKLPFHANRANSIEKYLKASLEKLQLDYIDLYLIHAPFAFRDGDEFFPKDETGKLILDTSTDHVTLWKAMEAQVDAGRTRAIGLSNFNVKQIEKIVSNARIPPASLQVELHLYFQQKPIVDFCKLKNILVTSYSSLGSPGTMKIYGKDVPSIIENEKVKQIAKKLSKTPAQIVLRFIVQNGTVVIPKSTNEKRIQENFQLHDFVISEEDCEILKSLDQGENGRLLLFQEHFPGIEKHPEFPFPA